MEILAFYIIAISLVLWFMMHTYAREKDAFKRGQEYQRKQMELAFRDYINGGKGTYPNTK